MADRILFTERAMVKYYHAKISEHFTRIEFVRLPLEPMITCLPTAYT